MSTVYRISIHDMVSKDGLSTYLSRGESTTVDGVEYVKTGGGWMQERTGDWHDTAEAARIAAVPALLKSATAIEEQIDRWREGNP